MQRNLWVISNSNREDLQREGSQPGPVTRGAPTLLGTHTHTHAGLQALVPIDSNWLTNLDYMSCHQARIALEQPERSQLSMVVNLSMIRDKDH